MSDRKKETFEYVLAMQIELAELARASGHITLAQAINDLVAIHISQKNDAILPAKRLIREKRV